MHEIFLKLSFMRSTRCPSFELTTCLSIWAPRDTSIPQAESHDIFLKLSSTRCHPFDLHEILLKLSSTKCSSRALRDISQIEIQEILFNLIQEIFIKLSTSWCFSSWDLRDISQIELHEMPLNLTSKKYLSHWAVRDTSQIEPHEVFIKLSFTRCSSILAQ